MAPSGECLRGYKSRAADSSRLVPRVAASCLAKPSCYTWPAHWYSLCCPAWQLVCVCMHCIDLFSCKAASVCFNKLTLTSDDDDNDDVKVRGATTGAQ